MPKATSLAELLGTKPAKRPTYEAYRAAKQKPKK